MNFYFQMAGLEVSNKVPLVDRLDDYHEVLLIFNTAYKFLLLQLKNLKYFQFFLLAYLLFETTYKEKQKSMIRFLVWK